MEMKKLLFVSLFLALIFGVAKSFDFQEKDLASDTNIWDLYDRWGSHHTISRSPNEKNKRFNTFKSNAMHVLNTNKLNKPYKLKLNKFADMTNDEFKSLYANSNIDCHGNIRASPRGKDTFMYDKVSNVPSSVDWRKNGAVTNVKNQGHCGK